MKNVTLSKRFFLMVMVAWITFISVFGAYQQSCKCAEWVVGTLASIGAGPIMTGLMICGVVVAGGVALYELSQTDAEDHQNFINGIKQGYQEFVAEQEKKIALENDQSLSDQEAADLGVAAAREYTNNFFSNAIEGVTNTTKSLTEKAVAYWKLYGSIINNVADNGVISDSFSPTSEVSIFHNNGMDYFPVSNVHQLKNIGSNCKLYNDNYYIVKGQGYGLGSQIYDIDCSHYSDGIFPFVTLTVYKSGENKCNLYQMYYQYSANNNTVDFIKSLGNSIYGYSFENAQTLVKTIIENTNVPLFLTPNITTGDIFEKYLYEGKYVDNLSVWSGSGTPSKNYEQTLNNTLTSTKLGEAIRTGRRVLDTEGDHIGTVFKEDSIPVKKSGISVLDGVVSGQVGWDIPSGEVWDDYYKGARPFGDVVGGTGSVAVPDGSITGTKNGDTVVDYPDSATVQDSSDYPRDDPEDKPEETPDKPQTEVFENQGGTFFPSAMDLTNIFPFCIPFDVIYLVEKFDASGDNAPVIHIPIVYPEKLQSYMGAESYDVVIDFADFIVVRNVLRTFLLILFIAGLLKVTRDLIRG